MFVTAMVVAMVMTVATTFVHVIHSFIQLVTLVNGRNRIMTTCLNVARGVLNFNQHLLSAHI